jgi:hypothetical protein
MEKNVHQPAALKKEVYQEERIVQRTNVQQVVDKIWESCGDLRMGGLVERRFAEPPSLISSALFSAKETILFYALNSFTNNL